MIDLHTHSTASDGTLTPTELVHAATAANLTALGLTDHDTLGGLAEARQTVRDLEATHGSALELVTGVELSVTHGSFKFHLLGLFIPSESGALQTALDQLIADRNARNATIIGKLQALNLDITMEDVIAKAGDAEAVGRPHIASVLLEKNIVTSVQEAFGRYLGSKGKAYAPKEVLTAAEAMPLLQECGATPVLAHPFFLNLGATALAELVTELRALGLDGIEAYYTEHSSSQTEQYLALAKRLDLAVSGGSDFHGATKPGIQLGCGKGGLRVQDAVLTQLKERRLRQGLPV